MNIKKIELFLLLVMVQIIFSCEGKTEVNSLTVTDIEGNRYEIVKIGNQTWMAENLKVTKYPDGTDITLIYDDVAWVNRQANNTDGAMCYYGLSFKNKEGMKDTYGALYTYAAAIAENWEHCNKPDQGVCPDGWHLPSDKEWKILEKEIGLPLSEIDNTGWRGIEEGTKLKSKSGWNADGNGSDDYGFRALPGGSRNSKFGISLAAGDYGHWWTRTEKDNKLAWTRVLNKGTATVNRSSVNKSEGLSIRCLKD